MRVIAIETIRGLSDAVEFCELYDQNCFDPTYESPLSGLFSAIDRRGLQSRFRDFLS